MIKNILRRGGKEHMNSSNHGDRHLVGVGGKGVQVHINSPGLEPRAQGVGLWSLRTSQGLRASCKANRRHSQGQIVPLVQGQMFAMGRRDVGGWVCLWTSKRDRADMRVDVKVDMILWRKKIKR